jgi:hypothetical protein
VEENDNQYSSHTMMEQGELATDTSNAENIINEIKNEASAEEKQETSVLAKLMTEEKLLRSTNLFLKKEHLKSDESFENLEAYHHDKKIKLANIKGLKAVQSLFDDDHLERDMPKEKTVPEKKKRQEVF